MQRPPLLLALAALLAGMAAAGAHAFLDHAAPPVGSTLRAAPPFIRIWFSEPVEPAFSSIQVYDASRQRVDRGNAAIDPRDATLLQVPVAPLPPGAYKVVWRVVSVDTHPTEGSFTFRIAAEEK